ncbi:MAG: hypothetical protein ACK500_06750 [Flavobacteriales bacterium]|jgi:hypothetical protein
MRISYSAILCLIGLSFTSTAQDYVSGEPLPDNLPLFQINEALLSSGAVFEKIPQGGMREFRLLAPGSEILKDDITRFSSTPSVGSFGNAFTAQIGLSIRNKEKTGYHPGRTLRLGINYFSQNRYSFYSTRTITSPWDTLASAQTGEQVIVDSTYMESYFFDYWVDHLRLDAALIFSTVKESRWSWFGGLGMTFGPSLISETSVTYSESRGTKVRGTNPSYGLFGNGNLEVEAQQELYSLKTVIGGSVYLPAGVDFRIGKRREFWKPVHLFYEIRPQVLYTNIPELGSSLRGGIQQGFGIRVKWR